VQLGALAGVAHCKPLGHQVPRPEGRFRHLERIEHELLHHVLVALARDVLDHTTGENEPGVVVRPQFAEGRQLRQRGHPLDVGRCRVVTPTGVVEVVADPASGVREQVPQRDTLGGGGICQFQAREVLAHRPVDVELAAGDELENDRPRERLRDRPGLEAGVRCHLQRVLDARDAEGLVALDVTLEQPDRDAGNVELLLRRAHRLEHVHGDDSKCLARRPPTCPSMRFRRLRSA